MLIRSNGESFKEKKFEPKKRKFLPHFFLISTSFLPQIKVFKGTVVNRTLHCLIKAFKKKLVMELKPKIRLKC